MLKRIALGVLVVLALAVAAVLVLAASKPDIFEVQRTAAIKAAPERIFPLIDDFRQWSAWSPYEHRDPTMQRTFGATTRGKGAGRHLAVGERELQAHSRGTSRFPVDRIAGSC